MNDIRVSSPPVSRATPANAPLNYEQLLARCLGNIEFADRILNKFQQRFGDDLDLLQQACDSANAEHVALVAHRLKGTTATVAADGLREIIAEIEDLGRAQRLTDVPPCLEELRREWQEFVAYTASISGGVR